MPSGTFDIGVSALLASQRQLSTTGHNIANVNTAGYSRQQVTLRQRPPQFVGDGFLGKGVDVAAISRSASEFVTSQVRTNTANEARAVRYSDLAKQVDTVLADSTLAPALTRFFQALQDANNNPSSTAARQVFVTTAKALTERTQDLDTRFSGLGDSVNQDIRARVGQLNSLTSALANLNQDIVHAYGESQGPAPNDLLDQRDQLLKEMSQLVGVSVVEQSDHSVSVYIGNGQPLVAGSTSVPMSATVNPLDGSQLDMSLTSGASTAVVNDAITNGSLAGLLDFRNEVLNPTRGAIGRLAAGLDFTLNSQHRAGLDLTGATGGDLFTLGSPTLNAAAGNTGTISLALDASRVGNLTDSDYELIHDGTNFILTRKTDGVQRTLSGAGPFAVDGMTITVTGVPASGDKYLLLPTRSLARGFGMAFSDPLKLALASPVKSSAVLTNISTARIGAPQVIDPTNVSLQIPTTLVFNTPPTTFQLNGAGPLIPYTSGANISVNGWQVQITGAPAAGDTFRVDPNTDGRGDNTNGLALAAQRTTTTLLGGTASYNEAFSQVVSKVGAEAQQAQIRGDALKVQRESAESARDSIAGVNLDEEAADLLRFQQSFQAAAELIKVANETFNALLQATR